MNESSSISPKSSYGALFALAVLYLIVDYGRPQDFLPISALRPGMILSILLILTLFTSETALVWKAKQIWMVIYFALLLALFVPFATNNYYAYKAMLTVVLFIPFILAIVTSVRTVERLKTLLFLWVLLALYVSVYGLFHRGVGSGNYFADENDLSLYINMSLPFCFMLLFYEKSFFRRAVALFAILAGLTATVISFSRGGFVGLVCVAGVYFFYSKHKIRIGLTIAAIAIVALVFASSAYWDEMSTITDTKEATANARLLTWESAWYMFLDNPLGVGGGNFRVRFPEYQVDEFQRGMWGKYSHSLWFTLLSELGVVGVVIYLRLIYYNLKDIFFLRKVVLSDSETTSFMRSLALAFLASLAGYFSSGSLLSVLYYPHYWYITGIIVATASIARSIAKSEHDMQTQTIR